MTFWNVLKEGRKVRYNFDEEFVFYEKGVREEGGEVINNEIFNF